MPLYLVFTPIGNLEDITLRALRVLREADVIAAEDTRHTGRLLAHYDIKKPLISLHEHNEKARIQSILNRLVNNEQVALVSDAGAPTVSDPGYQLVKAAGEAGFQPVPVPGPSAFLAALTASGLPTDRFTFLGFPPRKTRARADLLHSLRHEPGVLIFYESPRRLAALLTAIAASLVIGMFEGTIQSYVALAVLMPIVASMGGNAGTQSLTVVVRQLALGDIAKNDAFRTIRKEVILSLANGLLFAIIIGVVAAIWFDKGMLGVVIALSMIINLLSAGFFGSMIPLMLKKLNIDPAIGSTVILTTITDVVGFFSFLGLASLILL